MDPNAAYHRIWTLTALLARDYWTLSVADVEERIDELREAHANLNEWLARGGFAPDGLATQRAARLPRAFRAAPSGRAVRRARRTIAMSSRQLSLPL